MPTQQTEISNALTIFLFGMGRMGKVVIVFYSSGRCVVSRCEIELPKDQLNYVKLIFLFLLM